MRLCFCPCAIPIVTTSSTFTWRSARYSTGRCVANGAPSTDEDFLVELSEHYVDDPAHRLHLEVRHSCAARSSEPPSSAEENSEHVCLAGKADT